MVLCIYHSINVKTEERYGAPIHKASVQTVLSSVCVPCGPWPRLSSGLYLWPTEAHSGVGARPCSISMQGAGGMVHMAMGYLEYAIHTIHLTSKINSIKM